MRIFLAVSASFVVPKLPKLELERVQLASNFDRELGPHEAGLQQRSACETPSSSTIKSSFTPFLSFLRLACATQSAATMPQFQMRHTVDRLDKPSSYAMSKYKKRKRHEPRDQDDHEMQRQPDYEDKLATATTLYVGNLR